MLVVGGIVGIIIGGAVATVATYQFAETRLQRQFPTLDRQGNLFDQQLVQSGILSCVDAFGGLGDQLTKGTQFAVRSHWTRDSSDASDSISALVGMSAPNPAGGPAKQTVGTVFAAADGRGRCAGYMVRVSALPVSCNAFAAGRPQDARLGPALEDLTTVDLASGEQTILLPTDTGCVAVSTAAR
ncbi:MAG TPA: hypothetical protein VG894_13250 [Bauldia sp.]|nr:hypothetical protein [Bauldia sp.]